jgi:thiamine-monophosphate kinase
MGNIGRATLSHLCQQAHGPLWSAHLGTWPPTSLEARITIGELGEFALIAAISKKMPPDPEAIVGNGDDAAVLRLPDSRIVATTDVLVENRHFRREWSTGTDVGVKAAAQNLADVAAMGAVPVALLVGLAAPPDLPVTWAEDLAGGLAQEAARAGAYVVGGDLSGADEIVVAVTALGTLAGLAPVTRGGARPSDVVAVTGRLGHAAAGLALLTAGLAEPAGLIAAQLRPQPPYPAGPEAAALGATAMIDISDGLIQDLGHVAAASGVAIDLDTARLRPGPELAAAARVLGPATASAGLGWILSGGEDHALTATFPRNIALPSHWKAIGEVREGHGVWVDGMNYQGQAGWQHFR